MKVAFIGNMNNNHFAMMRYFHDLGVEAYLFKYANEHAHFQPECDTYEMEKWAPYIIETDIINGDYKQFLTYSPTYLHDLFSGYDCYVGSGFAPAYFRKAGLTLDLFLPYCVGIEFTFRFENGRFIDKIKEKLVARSQINGIKRSVKLVGTADADTLKKALDIGVPTEKLAIPMVYNNSTVALPSNKVEEIVKQIQQFNFTVFSHVSHFPYDNFTFQIKRNDILIQAFAAYIQQNPSHNAGLILLEYGENVSGSKKMIEDLGITNHVIWLPILNRKEIMYLLDYVDMGAGEFGGYFWGGTGWEFLSKGKLFFQFVDLTDAQIADMMQMPVPPFINTNDVSIIAQQMAHYYHHRDELVSLSATIKGWFNQYAGLELARKHLTILQQLNH